MAFGPPQNASINLEAASNGPEPVEGLVERPLAIPFTRNAASCIIIPVDFAQQASRLLADLPEEIQRSSFVYILRLTSGMLYTGSTANIIQRMRDHAAGIACKTTHDDKPQSLLFIEPHPTFPAARTREAQIKRWSRAKKEALVIGDMKSLRLLSKSREKLTGT